MQCARRACTRVAGVLSPIQQAEREDAIADWLADHGVDTAIADPLAETAVTIDALDRIAAAVSGPPLGAALRWAAAGCSVRGLASEIQEAAMRISGLVVAIKGFTHMDQATVAEPVDLPTSLGNTVAVLKAKARAKSVAVAVNVEPGLPRVRGFVGELNQIWANLIDNALDAVPEVRPGRGDGEPRAATRRGPRHRQRSRHSRRDPRPPLRAVFHHQAGREGHRPGPRHRPASGQPQRRRDRGRDGARANRVSRLPSARRGRRGGSTP